MATVWTDIPRSTPNYQFTIGSPIGLLLALTWDSTTIVQGQTWTPQSKNPATWSDQTKN